MCVLVLYGNPVERFLPRLRIASPKRTCIFSAQEKPVSEQEDDDTTKQNHTKTDIAQLRAAARI